METQKVFGDSSSVAAFDRLANTLASLATTNCSLPTQPVHRTLPSSHLRLPHSARHSTPTARSASLSALVSPLPVLTTTKQLKTCQWEPCLAPVSTPPPSLGPSKQEAPISTATRQDLFVRFPLNSTVTPAPPQVTQHLWPDVPLLQSLPAPPHSFSYYSPGPPHPDDPAVTSGHLRPPGLGECPIINSAGGLPIPHRPTAPSLMALTFMSDAVRARFVKSGGHFIPFASRNDCAAMSLGLSASGTGAVLFYAHMARAFPPPCQGL